MIGQVYYTMNGKQFNDLGSLVTYYDVKVGDGISIARIMYYGVKVGEISVSRLSAEVRRNKK